MSNFDTNRLHEVMVQNPLNKTHTVAVGEAIIYINSLQAELAKYQTLFAKIDGFVKDGDNVVLRGTSEIWEGIVAGIGSMSGHGEKWDSLRDALAALVNLEIGHGIRFADEEGPACTTTSA